jgi:hypothetical protein
LFGVRSNRTCFFVVRSNRIVVRCFEAGFEPAELNRPIGIGIFESIS